jgi:hypothetical protein
MKEEESEEEEEEEEEERRRIYSLAYLVVHFWIKSL